MQLCSFSVTADQRYKAYGLQRDAGPVSTDHRFTGQKQDGSGLTYMNARYYDPSIGTFISPDTIVPDAGNVFDYNRFMYVRRNVMKFSDPTGHLSQDEIGKYYGYMGEDRKEILASMLNDGWDESLAKWLLNPDTSFGEVFTYFDIEGNRQGEAMLVLFEASKSWTGARTYRGGFYGLSGDKKGEEVLVGNISSIDDDTEEATNYEGMYFPEYSTLPKKTGSDHRNYYDPLTYFDYGNWSTSSSVIGGVSTAYSVATCGSARGISCVMTFFGMSSMAPPGPYPYPVIHQPNPPVGNQARVRRFGAPRGFYE